MAETSKNTPFDYFCIVLRRVISAKWYLTLRYKWVFKKKPDWKNPQTFSEKLQWIKIYGYKSLYSVLVDKVKVKEFVAEKIGPEYVIPTLGVWDKTEQIDFDSLPDKFVLKCNHASGDAIVCTDKAKLDIPSVCKSINKTLKYNYYLRGMETPYKYVERKVFAEQYMHDAQTNDIRDYKFFCFNGEPKILFIASDRSSHVKFDFFDMDYNHLDLRHGYPNAEVLPEKPRNFELMKDLAAKLSNGIPHVRVDLYEINGKVYFGEMTFFHHSGLVPFDPESWDAVLGNWLQLPDKRK